jgi:hypothetical protein
LYAHEGTTLIIDDVSVSGGTLGIDSKTNLESAIMVYPNPAHDVLMIKKPENIQLQQISLYNNLGREIIQFKKQQTTLNVSGLKPGLYFLKLHTDKGVIVKKIVID